MSSRLSFKKAYPLEQLPILAQHNYLNERNPPPPGGAGGGGGGGGGGRGGGSRSWLNRNNDSDPGFNVALEENILVDEGAAIPPTGAVVEQKSEVWTVIVPSVLFLASNGVMCMAYYQTLEGGETEQWLHARLYGMALMMIISDIFCIVSILCALMAEGRWRKVMLAYDVVSVVCLFLLDQGTTTQHHGAYNTLAFIVFFLPMFIVFISMRACYVNLSFKGFFIVNTGIVFGLGILFLTRIAYVRNDWDKGLLGRSFDHSGKYACHIEPPAVNAMAVLPYRAWNFWAGSIDCPTTPYLGHMDKESGLLTITCDSKAEYTILPAVNKFRLDQKLGPVFQQSVLNASQTFTYTEPVIIDAEAVAVECGGERNVFIRSIEKQDVKARLQEYEKVNPRSEDRLDVIFLNFDAVARAHFHRRFPKTRDFLSRMHSSKEVEFFEFFRYHVLAPYTHPNLIPMYTGISGENEDFRNASSIWDLYREGGFVSASVDNSCLDWSAKYQKHRVSVRDHEFVAPFCQPEVHPLHNPYGNFKGPFSLLRRCLAGRYVHQYSFEYLSQYILQYSNLPKFVIAAFNEGHEGTGEVIGLVDVDLVKFLELVDYNNTALFIVSDHGLHMNPLLAFREESVIKENALGLLTTVFPHWFLKKHEPLAVNFRSNQQALVTPFEIFETLRHLITFPSKGLFPTRSPHSLSLFDQVPFQRSCVDAGIPVDFCICNKEIV